MFRGGLRLIVTGCALLGACLPACTSVRRDEALAILDVSAEADVPAFTTVHFSIVGRPEIPAHEVAHDPGRSLRFGYYLPGPDGQAEVQAVALSSPICILGVGTAAIQVELGHVSPAVALSIARAPVIDPACLDDAADAGPSDAGDAGPLDTGDASDAGAAGDAAADGDSGDAVDAADATADAPSDAPTADTSSDASPDVTTDAPTDARPDATVDAAGDARPDAAADAAAPACTKPALKCSSASACCNDLACATTVTSPSAKVCCGNFNAGCSMAGGQDCCGALDCFGNKCCTKPVQPCSASANTCCGGRACAFTASSPNVRICCGNAGASCSDTKYGTDCCGQLLCTSAKVCR